MRTVEIIQKKRGNVAHPKGEELSREELQYLIQNYVSGTVPDYQVSAWLMAVYFNGMSFAETGILTDIMLHSGETIDLSSLRAKAPFVDKHSTGGVGDKISLPLAPIAAACGVTIPMMSGRALGHTGGTLDKLESIEGYRTNLTQEEFRSIINSCGFAMTGQTRQIVPADKLLYALRDVTATVESIPLITASILSKKIAEGSDCLVLDVKYGNGAFMKNPHDAEQLALCMVNTLKAMNKKSAALITNMETPLGRKIGNFLEIEESIECLQGKAPADVMELTLSLGAWMCVFAEKAKDLEQGRKMCEKVIADGSALALFYKNVEAQGGNAKKLQNELFTRRSTFRRELTASQDGYIYIEAYKTGLAGCSLGVGRNRTDEAVCPDAGIILNKVSGDFVKKGDVIMEVFGKDELCFDSAMPLLEEAVCYANEPDPRLQNKLILKTISSTL